MQMIAPGQAGHPAASDLLTLLDRVAHFDGNGRHVTVKRLDAQTVIVDFDQQRAGLVDSTGDLLYNLAKEIHDLDDEQNKMSDRQIRDEILKQVDQFLGKERAQDDLTLVVARLVG